MTDYAEDGRGGSAVSVDSVGSELVCRHCRLTGGLSFYTTEYDTMLDHLDFHTLVHHHVPAEVFVHLRADRDGLA